MEYRRNEFEKQRKKQIIMGLEYHVTELEVNYVLYKAFILWNVDGTFSSDIVLGLLVIIVRFFVKSVRIKHFPLCLIMSLNC